MTISAALAHGTARLDAAGVSVPRLTAEVLLAHALDRNRIYLTAHSNDVLESTHTQTFDRYLHERIAGRPTQYITGRQEWFGREFLVNESVLIPRPETEHLVELALEIAGNARRILDVGCGSGIIGITLALELRRRAKLSDISLAALAVARENARRLSADVDFLTADLTSAIAPASIDLLISNPPYVPLVGAPALAREVRDHEPALALFGGDTGLDVYRQLIADAPRILSPGGRLIFELGAGQSLDVLAMLDAPCWTDRAVHPDLAGIDRVITARLNCT